MFKRILQTSMLLAFLGLMITSLAYSNNKMGIKNELHQKIQDYKLNNIIPKLNDWKMEIDKNLKKDDLEKLNVLRNKAALLKKQKIEEFKILAENPSMDRSEKKDKLKENGKNIRNDMKDISAELKPIILNNIDFLKKLGETAKPFAEKWKTDINNIVDQWKAANKDFIESNNKMGNENRGDFGMRGFGKFDGSVDKGKRFIAMILLYNGDTGYGDEELLGPDLMKVFSPESTTNIDVKISPNPFSDIAKINFNLIQNSKVKLNITDEAGRIVADLFEGNLGKGNQVFEFKPKANNPIGVYIYNLVIDGKVFNGKIMYSK